MRSIIFIATVLIGVAIANNCKNPLVANLITDATMNAILECASPKDHCTIPWVYRCMKYDFTSHKFTNDVSSEDKNGCMRNTCPTPRSAFQCVLDKVGRTKAYDIARAGIVDGFTESVLDAASTWANSGLTDWRPDARCGAKYPLADGSPGRCNPNGKWPCCSPGGWCGDSDDHCKCKGCTDFRILGPQRADARCGPEYPSYGDGKPTQCDPFGKWPCCSPGNWCGNTKWHCKCDSCTNTDFRHDGEEAAFQIRNAAVEFAIDCNKDKPEFVNKYMCEILHPGNCHDLFALYAFGG